MIQSGVYQIVNTIDNKRYIGSAVNLRKRKNEHFAHLRRGVHHSIYLQRAYNKHGRDAFCFEILMYAPISWIIEIEQALLNIINPEYNLSIKAGSRLGAPQPDSMKIAQSKRMKQRWASMSDTERNAYNKKRAESNKRHWANRTIEERRLQMEPASAANRKK